MSALLYDCDSIVISKISSIIKPKIVERNINIVFLISSPHLYKTY
jgi:hypothetical protein